ncbi:Transmembrane_domain-containing protein [Hexamita inflata]|uniref:Transmembrane domain-containing protein n=1 Tax=Hexamita inflata TaxID=28002 RepID=A0AA86RHE7_9EUKA|nr:Transmembrane domain-containing protein [Hexamita inflata]
MSANQAFSVKITYTLLLLAVFGIGLVFSFDFMITSKQYLPKSFDLSREFTFSPSDLMKAKIQTNILSFNLEQGYYSESNKSFSSNNETDKFFRFKDNLTQVEGADSWSHEVRFVSREFIYNNEDKFQNMYTIALASTITGFALPVIVILVIWVGCIGWCECDKQKLTTLCNKQNKSESLFEEKHEPPNYYVENAIDSTKEKLQNFLRR